MLYDLSGIVLAHQKEVGLMQMCGPWLKILDCYGLEALDHS